MNEIPNCPKCNCEYVYEDGNMFVCPECAHEWIAAVNDTNIDDNAPKVFKDANGNVLNDGDTVTVLKDLKVKGTSKVLKMGTKVKNIRLVNGDHDIDCRAEGIGAIGLKSKFVKKA